VATAGTSNPEQLLPRLREVRASVVSLEASLQRPDLNIWEQAAPQLQRAASMLAAVERTMAATEVIPLDLRAELKTEVQDLARDVRRIHALMRGRSFCARLSAATHRAGLWRRWPLPSVYRSGAER
jgi:hypothetical protein